MNEQNKIKLETLKRSYYSKEFSNLNYKIDKYEKILNNVFNILENEGLLN